METIFQEVLKIIINCKNYDPTKLNPIRLDLSRAVSPELIENLVSLIDDDYDTVRKEIKYILEAENLHTICKEAKFAIEVSLNSNKNISVINLVLEKIVGFKISEDKIQTLLEKPESIIKHKLDYQSDIVIDKMIDKMILGIRASESKNTAFNSSPRSFIIAQILIKNQLSRYFDPIDDLSNDYKFLIDHFQTKNSNLLSDEQFLKYHLISIDTDTLMVEAFPARIFKQRINTTIFLNGSEDYTFRYLLELNRKYDFSLSLKPSSFYFLEGKYEIGKVEEHLETGKYFDINSIAEISLTKLYDNDYDTLWVKVDNFNITFEEILHNYKIHGDSIYTQVIHCQYEEIHGKLFVNHIDHEFIFYSIDEFEKRNNDANQKGENKKRIKTFKIDNGQIPINEDDNILYNVLKMKFENQELLSEYFREITN